ncbi:MAG: sigma-54 dependent transcriptional regulator [Gammaproteobacteria bacterium]|nr:sigma-54 dependent transcriptional regulator [Gammaproteobacteria bacterium]
MSSSTVLVVEDDASLREALCDTLQQAGYGVATAADGRAALELLGDSQRGPAIGMVVSDVQMNRMDGHTLLKQLRQQRPDLPVLLMTAYGTIKHAVEAMRDGAVDYLVKPFEAEALIQRVTRFVVRDTTAGPEWTTRDARTREITELARRVAGSDATVMIGGESGTGKEVLARFIHQHSRRSKQPFIAINCAAIPDNMLEATLFGYEKGAFTGAYQACPGKFEQADGGTLLLDEISEMNLGLQAKLLRVLQEREVERLGGRKTIPLNVRVLTTSNRIMREEVSAGRFREDLFYRLNVFPLYLPPLRERIQDILPLATHLLARHARAAGQTRPEFTPAAEQKLLAHQWPGNVRELDNLIQRVLILHCGDKIGVEALSFDIDQGGPSGTETAVTVQGDVLGHDLKAREQDLIVEALRAGRGSRKYAAERLGISERTLRYKLARLREAGVFLPGSVLDSAQTKPFKTQARFGVENA